MVLNEVRHNFQSVAIYIPCTVLMTLPLNNTIKNSCDCVRRREKVDFMRAREQFEGDHMVDFKLGCQ